MNRKAFAERLREIKMSEHDAQLYEQYAAGVRRQAVLWIRIRSDQKLFAGSGSGVGSGTNHSGSGQPLSGINLKQNFSDKIHNFSTRLCIHFPIRYHTDRMNYGTCSRITDFKLVHFLKNFIYRRNFTNTVRVCRATLSRRKPALPNPKQDPESEPKLP
jgi:hypothetical protein